VTAAGAAAAAAAALWARVCSRGENKVEVVRQNGEL